MGWKNIHRKSLVMLQQQYKIDEHGKEILLQDDKHQVMMEWEKPYMESCIDKLQPKGDVLEIGFGMGYSATQIQKYKPKSHTIIEMDPMVIKRLEEWAKDYDNIIIVEGTWQKEIHNLEFHDCKDFLEMAEIIKGSKFFIGNECFAYSIAESLKIPRLLEASPDFPVVFPTSSNGYDFYHQNHFEKLFKNLSES